MVIGLLHNMVPASPSGSSTAIPHQAPGISTIPEGRFLFTRLRFQKARTLTIQNLVCSLCFKFSPSSAAGPVLFVCWTTSNPRNPCSVLLSFARPSLCSSRVPLPLWILIILELFNEIHHGAPGGFFIFLLFRAAQARG